MAVTINGTSGITTPGFTSTAASTVSGGALTAAGVTLSSGSITYPNADTQAVGPLGGPGSNQSWQTVTGSRALDTNYTNTTGRPIFVAVRGISPGGSTSGVSLQVDSINIPYSSAISSNPTLTVAIVPAGSVYRCNSNGCTLGIWTELR